MYSDQSTSWDFHDWPPPTILQPLPVSKNSIKPSIRYVEKRKIYHSYFNLFWFSACSQDEALGPITLLPNFELLAEFFLHSLSILQKQRCPNAKSLHISSAVSWTNKHGTGGKQLCSAYALAEIQCMATVCEELWDGRQVCELGISLSDTSRTNQ